jgi:hypothetical protein
MRTGLTPAPLRPKTLVHWRNGIALDRSLCHPSNLGDSAERSAFIRKLPTISFFSGLRLFTIDVH